MDSSAGIAHHSSARAEMLRSTAQTLSRRTANAEDLQDILQVRFLPLIEPQMVTHDVPPFRAPHKLELMDAKVLKPAAAQPLAISTCQ
jgi:hypothetical protein